MLTRRAFAQLGLGLMAASAGVLPGARRAQAAGSLVFAGWGGDYQNKDQRLAFIDPFTKHTGVSVTPVASPGNMVAIIKSQVDNKNPEWDVVELTEPELYLLSKQGYLLEIAYDDAAKSSMPANLLNPYGAAISYAAFVLAWNSTEQKKPLATWADMWNVSSFPGARTACSWFPYENVEIALLAGGMTPAEIYPLDDAKIQKAFASWRALKKDLKVWWNAGGQSAQLFSDREVSVGAIYENRAREASAANSAVTWTINQAIIEKVHFVIPKSSQKVAEATQFINTALKMENQATFVKTRQYGAANPRAYELLTDKEKSANIGLPANLAKELLYDGKFWADAYPKYAETWEALKAGN